MQRHFVVASDDTPAEDDEIEIAQEADRIIAESRRAQSPSEPQAP